MLNWLKKLFQGKRGKSSEFQESPSQVNTQTKTHEIKSSNASIPAQSGNSQIDINKSPKITALVRQTSIADASEKFVQARSSSKRARPPVQPSPVSEAVWFPPGKTVKVADYCISGGMVYVGTYLECSGPYAQIDPCLINPRLRINKSKPDYAGSGMGYWPSYSEIPPKCRAAYLEWLASSRSDPNAYIGYVFLFFYGLERRVFKDLRALKIDDSGELTQIKAEVERLLKIYGNNNSFNEYASCFLDVCRLLQKSEDFYKIQPPLEKTGWEVPLSIKIVLGQRSVLGEPIPVDWLLSWYLHSEQARLRTPATRCAEEFRRLLRRRYLEKYGEGMILKPNKRRLKFDYRPASSGFSGLPLAIEVGDLPDITARSGPLKKLQVLIDECTDALAPYSRWLGRNADSRDYTAALALLPPELIEDFEDSDIRKLRQWLAQTLGANQHLLIGGKELLSQWSSSSSEKLTKKESMMLSQGLEKFGYGIEPDVRFRGKPLKSNGQIVLFRLGAENTSTPSKEYTAAALLLHLAVTVASADNVVDIAAQQYLEGYLETSLHLSEAERVRLRAHLVWLLQEKLSLRGLKPKLNEMTSDEKAGVVNFLISVAGADGHISPKEISILTKIYPLLGFEADEVYSHIHIFSTASQVRPATEPVTVRPASSKLDGFAIPIPPEIEDENTEVAREHALSSFTLDLKAIRQKQAESAKVANLLGAIFEEDELEPSEPEPQSAVELEVSIAGLDSVHSLFLQAIAQQDTWSRDALETKATDLGLMLDGALEVINDSAFDTCDEALTDGEDPIEINAEVLEQLLP